MLSHKERMQVCLRGETPDRPPVALWRHFPVDDQDPSLLARATVHFQQTYDFDLVKVTPSSSFEVKGWGVEDQWMGDAEGSRRYTKRVIQHPSDWENLQVISPSSNYLQQQLHCLRLIRRALTADTPVIQTIFNPLSQAKNLAGNDMLLQHIRDYPEAVLKGLETIARTTAAFVEAVCDTGVDGIFYAIQHAQADMLTYEEYQKFGISFDYMVLSPAEQLWCNMVHIHGKKIHFQLLDQLDFHIANWHDRETDPSLEQGKKRFKGAVCGGMRQDSLVFGTQEQVRAEAKDAIEKTNGNRFILGTGCVVPVIAPHGNILAARESVE